MPILVNNMNILGLIESTTTNNKNDGSNNINNGTVIKSVVGGSSSTSNNSGNNNTQFIEIPQLSEELIRSAVNGVSSKNSSSNQTNNNNNSQSNNAANTTSSSMDDDPDSPLYGPDGKAKKAHSCPFCDRSFTRPYRLNDHISFSHTDERKYMCGLCSKNFSCKDKLKHHIDVKHDNKKPTHHHHHHPNNNNNSNNNNNNNSHHTNNSNHQQHHHVTTPTSHPKTRTKFRNTEDLRCEYPNCTKVFANKYNVKRHIENVHLKMRRRRNKRSGNSHNNTGNTSSSSLNSSMNNSSTTTAANTTGNNSGSVAMSHSSSQQQQAAAAAAAALQLGIGNLATSLTSMSNLNLAGGHLTIAPKNYNNNNANQATTLLPTNSIIALPLSSHQQVNGSPLLGGVCKPEPSLSSTPMSKKGRAAANQFQQQQQQQQSFQLANLNNSIQLTSATPLTAANANLVNLSLNPAQTATLLSNGLGGGNNGQGGQMTLVATSNGIGGITLTTLGSLHQQHHNQQAQFQQFQQQQSHQHQQQQQQQQLVTNLASLGTTAGGTILTLNGQPILIQQAPSSNNNNNQQQQQQHQQITTSNGQHIIYQQQPTAILQPLGGSQSNGGKNNNSGGNCNSGNLLLNNGGIIGLTSSGTATAADLLGNHILLANNGNPIQLSQNGGMNSNNLNTNNNNNNNGGNLNAVAMAELVNSLLVKSDNNSSNNLLGSDGLLNFNELTTGGGGGGGGSDNIGNDQQQQHHQLHGVDFSNPSNNANGNDQQQQQQHNHLDEEKDNKIYTCARCPEIFNSSILLRKHVSENHEKEYECCICNMSFGNRFTFLKHKYSHINYETNRLAHRQTNHNSNNSNSRPTTDLIDFEEDETAEEEQLQITSTCKKSNQTVKDATNTTSFENLFDLNSIYKRSLMNSENLMQFKPELFENSRSVMQQGAVGVGSTVKLSSPAVNNSTNGSASSNCSVLSVYRKTNCCDICFKCFGEKKKLVSHRKICQAKMDTAKGATTVPTLVKSKSQVVGTTTTTISQSAKRLRPIKSMISATQPSLFAAQMPSTSVTPFAENNNNNHVQSTSGTINEHVAPSSSSNNPATSIHSADLPLNLDFLFE